MKQQESTLYRELDFLNLQPELIYRDMETLSGGSKAKLILVKLCLENYDVLLLDEPSRNLSPLLCPVLRRALNGYDGTIIMISHDRKLLNECAHSIYRLDVNGLTQTV